MVLGSNTEKQYTIAEGDHLRERVEKNRLALRARGRVPRFANSPVQQAVWGTIPYTLYPIPSLTLKNKPMGIEIHPPRQPCCMAGVRALSNKKDS